MRALARQIAIPTLWLAPLLAPAAAFGAIPLACHPSVQSSACTPGKLWSTYLEARERFEAEPFVDIPGSVVDRSPPVAPPGLPPGPELAWRLLVGAVSQIEGAAELARLADPTERHALLTLYVSFTPDPEVAASLAWALADDGLAQTILPWLQESGLPEARRKVLEALLACEGEEDDETDQCMEELPAEPVYAAAEVMPLLPNAGPVVRAGLLARTRETELPALAKAVLEGLDDEGVRSVWGTIWGKEGAVREALAAAVLARMLTNPPIMAGDGSPPEGGMHDDPLTEAEHGAFVALAETGSATHAQLWRAMAVHAEPWIALRGAIGLESVGLGIEAVGVWNHLAGPDGRIPDAYLGVIGAPATVVASQRFRAHLQGLRDDPHSVCAAFGNLPGSRLVDFAPEMMAAIDRALRSLDPRQLPEDVKHWLPYGNEQTRLAFCLYEILVTSKPSRSPELESLLAWMKASGAPLLRFFAAQMNAFQGHPMDLALVLEANPGLRESLGAQRIRRVAERLSEAPGRDVDSAGLARLGCIGWFAEAAPMAGAVEVRDLPRQDGLRVFRHASKVQGRAAVTRCIFDAAGKVVKFEVILPGS